MDNSKPSIARRALAVLVLVVVAVVAFRMVIGAITAVFWIVAVVALIIAGVWATSTLRSAKRARGEKRKRSAKSGSARQVEAAPPPEDRVEAQMRQIKEQLREQGRL